MNEPKGPEVLVVDDDDDLRAVIGHVLRDEGFSVAEASSGRAALDHLFASRVTPSLILLDMNMPVMSGREVIRVLRDYLRLSTIPVLVITSERRANGPTQGTVGLLEKPFSPGELMALVRQHVA